MPPDNPAFAIGSGSQAGKTTEVLPFGPQWAPVSTGLIGLGPPNRFIKLNGSDDDPEPFLVTAAQIELVRGSGAAIFPSGPLVAIVEWGNGGGDSMLEFNVQPAPAFYNPAQPPAMSGSSIVIHGKTVQVSIRNDSWAPQLRTAGGTFPIQGFELPGFNPFAQPPPGPPGVLRIGGRASCFASVAHGMNPSVLFTAVRELCVVNADSSIPAPPFPTGETISLGIPNFARRVSFRRSPRDTSSLSVLFGQPGTPVAAIGPYVVPVGSDGPIEIPAWAFFMAITNPAVGSAAITRLFLDFEVQP
jgi:hypothetical protein